MKELKPYLIGILVLQVGILGVCWWIVRFVREI